VGPKVTDADVWDLKRTNQFSAEWQWFEQRLAEKRADEPPVETYSDETAVDRSDESAVDRSDESAVDRSHEPPVDRSDEPADGDR